MFGDFQKCNRPLGNTAGYLDEKSIINNFLLNNQYLSKGATTFLNSSQ